MMYVYKPYQELAWFVLAAVLPVLLGALASFDPEAIADYRVWLASLGAATVRAVGGALLAFVAKLKAAQDGHFRDSTGRG